MSINTMKCVATIERWKKKNNIWSNIQFAHKMDITFVYRQCTNQEFNCNELLFKSEIFQLFLEFENGNMLFMHWDITYAYHPVLFHIQQFGHNCARIWSRTSTDFFQIILSIGDFECHTCTDFETYTQLKKMFWHPSATKKKKNTQLPQSSNVASCMCT